MRDRWRRMRTGRTTSTISAMDVNVFSSTRPFTISGYFSATKHPTAPPSDRPCTRMRRASTSEREATCKIACESAEITANGTIAESVRFETNSNDHTLDASWPETSAHKGGRRELTASASCIKPTSSGSPSERPYPLYESMKMLTRRFDHSMCIDGSRRPMLPAFSCGTTALISRRYATRAALARGWQIRGESSSPHVPGRR